MLHKRTVQKKRLTVQVNWGLKQRWFEIVLRVLNQILAVQKLGKPPKAHLVQIWADLAKIWSNQIVSGNPRG